MVRGTKLVLLGEHGVGKTCLASRWFRGGFRTDQPPTIGAAFIQKEVSVHGEPKKIQIWDTAGEERYHSMAPVYSEGASGAVIVFDVTRRETMTRIPAWVKCLSHCDDGIVILVVANKCDSEKREILFDEGEAYARALNFEYFETSAKTGAGVEEAFEFIVERICNREITSVESIALGGSARAGERRGCC
jgi:small GTP-binding protein